MPPRIPKLRFHKSGQARVEYKGETIYFGKWGLESTDEAYRQWAHDLTAAIPQQSIRLDKKLTITIFVTAYLDYAHGYYGKGEYDLLRCALRPVKNLFGGKHPNHFTPLMLDAVRNQLIEQGLSRSYINGQIRRIRRAFRWGVSRGVVRPEALVAIDSLEPLKRGRSKAKETKRKLPVPWEHVEPVLKHVLPPVAAMLQLQWHTGMRSDEICIMRTCDIDRSGKVWVYAPVSHKTQYKDKLLVVCLGPKAQAIVKPFLKPGSPEAYIFSPAEAVAARRKLRQDAKAPREKYRTRSYYRAVQRGIAKASVGREEPIPRWHPHQIRHSRATEVRKKYGIQGAKAALGHATISSTLIYAEEDLGLAARIARSMG